MQPKYPWVSLGEEFGVQHSNFFPNPPKNHLSSEHEYGPSHFSQPRRDKQTRLWQVLCSTPAHLGDTKTKTILPPRSLFPLGQPNPPSIEQVAAVPHPSPPEAVPGQAPLSPVEQGLFVGVSQRGEVARGPWNTNTQQLTRAEVSHKALIVTAGQCRALGHSGRAQGSGEPLQTFPSTQPSAPEEGTRDNSTVQLY